MIATINKIGFPLSEQQRQLWECYRGRSIGSVHCAVEITVPLDHARLVTALQQLVDSHESLRTHFRVRPGEGLPEQMVASPTLVKLPVLDLAEFGTSDRMDEVWHAFAQTQTKPQEFDLAPLHLKLVRLAPDRHFLFVGISALCADARSLENFVRELARRYAGTEASEPPIQYTQFTAWQAELHRDEMALEARGFWRGQQFDHYPRLLPACGNLNTEATPHAIVVAIDPVVWAHVKTLDRRYDVAPGTFLLGCWAAYLHRVTGASDVVIGVEHEGRDYPELVSALGRFARKLPLHVRFCTKTSFKDLLLDLRNSLEALCDRADYTRWDDVVLASGGGPESPSCFWFTEDSGSLEIPGFALRRTALLDSSSDIQMIATHGQELTLHFDPRRYLKQDALRIASGLSVLIAAAASDPAGPIDRLAAIGPDEEQELVVLSNQSSPANGSCFHRDFVTAAMCWPDTVAVTSATGSFSYRELDRRSNQFARALQRLGVGPEIPVALVMERSTDLIVAILGIMKSGGAFVPLDPALPTQRLAFCLADTAAPVIVTQRRFAPGLAPNPATIFCMDDDSHGIALEETSDPLADIGPENLAYILYTSGSTGVPKGVMVPHRGLGNYTRWAANAYGIAAGSTTPVHSSLSFDMTLTSLLPPLLVGGSVVLLNEAPGIESLVGALRQPGNFSVLKVTPTHLDLLRSTLTQDELIGRTCAFVIGGEALNAEKLEFWLRYAPGARIFNEYGPTETVVGCTVHEVNRDLVATGPVSIGRPIAGATIYLLDQHFDLVPFGAAGEVFVGGVAVSRGYLRRAGPTAACFVPDPFSKSPGARLYRTGDLARYRPSGDLEYLGRIDDQVKVHGYRIELGEIEAALQEHPGVEAAAVSVRENAAGDKRLVAYLVPDRHRAAPVRGILRLGREGLPAGTKFCPMPNGMTLVGLNPSETDMVFREIFEDRTYARHGITLEDGACIFDIGANIGMFSIFAAQQWPGCSIFAFEPIPPVFAALQVNAAMFGLNARLFSCGLGAQPGEAVLTHYQHASVLSGRFPGLDDRDAVRNYLRNQHGNLPQLELEELLTQRLTTTTFKRPLQTLSGIIADYGVTQIDLLKVDVEKSEAEVLAGLDDPDWARVRQAVVEVHDLQGRLQRIVAQFEKLGFQVEVEQDILLAATGIYNLFARRATPHRPPLAGQALPSVTQTRWYSADALVADVGKRLEEQLPRWMMPAAYICIEELPLAPSGKLDRHALPVPEQQHVLQRPYAPPVSAAEVTLTSIWQRLLGLDRVGIHDNFFEIGGDSIISIQLVALARQAGLALKPQDIFVRQTIAELAATTAAAPAPAPAAPLKPPDEAPLSPIQSWFFTLDLAVPNYWNQTALFELPSEVNPEILAAALTAVEAHHSGLRFRFLRSDESASPMNSSEPMASWKQRVASPSVTALRQHDLSAVPSGRQQASLRKFATELQDGLDIGDGPVWRAALVRVGSGASDRLLLTAHHLAIDALSWRILTEDIELAYRQIADGVPASLPPTVPFQQWVTRLAEYTRGGAIDNEIPYWLDQLVTTLPQTIAADDSPQPLLAENATPDIEDTVRYAHQSLDETETAVLLRDVPSAYRMRMPEVLLAALAKSFAEWTRARHVRIDIEGHGRQSIFPDLDISRTIGWFTTLHPILLDLESAPDLGALLMLVKEQSRRTPQHGIGFGLLRNFASGDAGISAIRGAAPALVNFNYLGEMERYFARNGFLQRISADTGPSRAPLNRRPYPIEVEARIAAGRLEINVAYSAGRFDTATMDGFAARTIAVLRDIIAHCLRPSAGAYTPADFPDADISQDDLDQILTMFSVSKSSRSPEDG